MIVRSNDSRSQSHCVLTTYVALLNAKGEQALESNVAVADLQMPAPNDKDAQQELREFTKFLSDLRDTFRTVRMRSSEAVQGADVGHLDKGVAKCDVTLSPR